MTELELIQKTMTMGGDEELARTSERYRGLLTEADSLLSQLYALSRKGDLASGERLELYRRTRIVAEEMARELRAALDDGRAAGEC